MAIHSIIVLLPDLPLPVYLRWITPDYYFWNLVPGTGGVMAFLSEILGRTITDIDGNLVGKLDDVIARFVQ